MTEPTDDFPARDDAAHLTLYAERPVVAKRVIETGLVQATRVTTKHDEIVDEELASDEVVVERVVIGRIVDDAPPVRQEGDTTVFSVVEEIVVVERRLVLKEEVHVRRVRSARPHSQTISLRRQDVVVTRTKIGVDFPSVGAMADSAPPSPPAQPPSPLGLPTMTDETIVAVYDTAAHANLAVADLREAGVPESAITTHASTTDGASTTRAPVREEGFWASLFGGNPDHDTTVYERSVSSGATVVTVKMPSEHADRIGQMLESHNPIDIDERATGYGLNSASATQPIAGAPIALTDRSDRSDANGNAETMKLSEERLTVGKRVVNNGGTRIRRFVVETPVEEQVTLREEHVTIDRRPVTDGQAVSNADFSEKTIEMRETAEEAVVSKQAFVTEEIALHKTATDRVETIKDTVRKEDVEVVQLPSDTTVKPQT